MLDPFPDPVGHFGAPWWPFWGPLVAILDFEVSDWSKYKECSDQETYLAKVAQNGL